MNCEYGNTPKCVIDTGIDSNKGRLTVTGKKQSTPLSSVALRVKKRRLKNTCPFPWLRKTTSQKSRVESGNSNSRRKLKQRQRNSSNFTKTTHSNMEEADKTQGKNENKLDGSRVVDVELLESSQGENLTEHADHALLTTEPRDLAEEGESGTTEQPAPSTQQEGAEEMEHTVAPHTTTEQPVQTASDPTPAHELEGDTVEETGGTAQTQTQIQTQDITEPPAHSETEGAQPTEAREGEKTGTEEMEVVVVGEVRTAAVRNH